MSGLYAQGITCYECKDFEGALDAFNRAITRSNDPGVQLLDKRAGCHMKMGNLLAALKDAKATVSAAQRDPTGYLRAGAILTRMGRRETALQVYAKGLSNVKPIGKGYTALRALYEKLSDAIAPVHRTDPMARLPPELAEMIIGYLSFRRRINACRVSREWGAFIRSCPDLWRHLDFSEAKNPVRNAFVSRAINAGKSNIKIASLHRMQDVNKTLSALFSFCQLEELNMLGTGFLGEGFLNHFNSSSKTLSLKILRFCNGTEMGKDVMMRLLPWCLPSLSVFECTGPEFSGSGLSEYLQGAVCTKLQEVKLHSYPRWSFKDLANAIPAVRKLHVSQYSIPRGKVDLRGLQCLEDLTIITDVGHNVEILLPRTLRSLSYHQLDNGVTAPEWFSSGGPAERLGSSYLPKLQSLQYEVGFCDLAQVLRFLSPTREDGNDPELPTATNAPKLHLLSLPNADFSNPANAQALTGHSRLTELQHLDLTGASLPNYRNDLGKICQNLKVLHLDKLNIDGADLRDGLIGPKLEHLSVRECYRLGHDAIAWARGKGIKVESLGQALSAYNEKKVRW